MNSLDYIVNKVLDVIKRDTKKKTSSYDAVGTVTRVEDNIAWVHFDNGVSETPVVMSIHCNKGDKVHVRVTSGTAFITGNETAPPSDDTEALVAKALAKLADSKAESAEATAADAQETAEKAANTAGTSLVTDTMHYLATTLSSGVTTSTPGWTTTVQSIDATNKYLWTYHTYTKANESSIDTTPVLTGRYGEDGTSVSILGSYSTYADLVAAHPTGNTGEAYMVGNDLYVWNGTAWEDVGQIKGDTGVGVASIAKTGTSGLIDTYTITYTDNSTSTYTVTNGQKGDTGAAGANGKTPYIQSGYWYIDGTSTGVKAEGDDGNTPYIQSGYWYINGTSTGIKAEGTNGTSVTAVQPQYYNHTSPTATQQEIDSWQWSTTLTYEAGKYIWTRDLVSYSNSTTTTSTAIYNEALTTACADAVSALEMAQNVNQHFWNETSGTEAGAHITEVSQEEWSDSTSANYHTGANLLLRSNTIKLRNALVTLAELTGTGLKVYEPSDSTNPVAQFLNTGAIIGKQTQRYTVFTNTGSEYWDGRNSHKIGERTFSYDSHTSEIDDRAISSVLTNTHAGVKYSTYANGSNSWNEATLQSFQGANGQRHAEVYTRAGYNSSTGEQTYIMGQVYVANVGNDSFEYYIDPATTNGVFDLNYGKLVAGNLDAGSDSITSTASGQSNTVDVTFNKTFTSAPKVVVGFTYDNSATGTANSFGNCSISAINITTTGFTAKFYNGSGSSKSPSFNWIALLP